MLNLMSTGRHASQHIISTPQPRCTHMDPDQIYNSCLDRSTHEQGSASVITDFRGARGYIAAMRKVWSHHPSGPLDESDAQAAALLSNDKAATFLDKLRHHSSRNAWEHTTSQRLSSPNTMAQQQSWWQVGKATVEVPTAARPWIMLAGPGFAPGCFAATGEPEDCAALEELKNPRKHVGPDVSHLPRPSDKLAFQHQHQGAEQSSAWPWIEYWTLPQTPGKFRE